MKRIITSALLTLLTCGFCAAQEPAPPAAEKPLVQLALLLDTSGSMSGMINQARNQLWAIVNEFIVADRDGVKPRVEVALYHYGSPALGQENGFIRQLTPLTEDLDKVSEELFKLTTSGGDEYCGWVIRTAVSELAWSKSNKDYKAVFIAGNESFAQGEVDFRKVCKDAIAKGIIVNTIHCSGGDNAGWKDGAVLADGSALAIDTDRVVVDIQTPFDNDIAELGQKLNGTYIAYGANGKEAAERQQKIDAKSINLSSANFAKRSRTKASAVYHNASWDLVDAQTDGEVKLEELKDEDLPEEMRTMAPQERQAYVDKKTAERKEIQRQIADLSTQRDTFVNDKQRELASNGDTLGDQVRQTVRTQATKSGFAFK